MCERASRPTTRPRSAGGFTLVELLVVILVGGMLLAAFTGFYVGQQRAFRRHYAEIEASQGLRTALEQMSRDLRAAGRDPLRTGTPGISYADATRVEFTLDADSDGVIAASDPNETKKFRLNSTTSKVESYRADQAAPWLPLADFTVSPQTVFEYYRCDNTVVTTLPASTADLAAIARVDLTLRVARTDGIPLTRTEVETIRLRNKQCS
jgi:prepilin-type N-terminal cleavage/methylation domain-containing protein